MLQKEKFPDFFFSFLERRFGPQDAVAWAYTLFENIKLFRSNEVMSQFYAVLMGKVSFSFIPACTAGDPPAQPSSVLVNTSLPVEERECVHQSEGAPCLLAEGDDKC